MDIAELVYIPLLRLKFRLARPCLHEARVLQKDSEYDDEDYDYDNTSELPGFCEWECMLTECTEAREDDEPDQTRNPRPGGCKKQLATISEGVDTADSHLRSLKVTTIGLPWTPEPADKAADSRAMSGVNEGCAASPERTA